MPQARSGLDTEAPVHGQHAGLPAERDELRLPHLAVEREGVQEHDRRPVGRVGVGQGLPPAEVECLHRIPPFRLEGELSVSLFGVGVEVVSPRNPS